ncbi:hypothetical protein MIR68_009719 [Amoeboaphelidium protococcarum]|nr:hypothetical protein MIR68_009719 [Amoeboaphelidium protococcarum]
MSDKIDYPQLNPAGPSSSVQSAPFVIKSLNRALYLSPAVETAAITSLAHQMTTHFAGKGSDPNDKATCVTCFDMSGSASSTTACSLHYSSRVAYLVAVKILQWNLEDYVLYEKVEEYMAEQFDNMLLLLCQSIVEQLDELDASNLEQGGAIEVSIPERVSPILSSEDTHTATLSLQACYKKVIEYMRKLDRLLVIHLDDCQQFFCGSTKNPEKTVDNKIRVGDLMCFAVRLFSRRVSSLQTCREKLWVFSGTRPNLYLEMKVASSFGEIYDVAKTLRDLTENDVATVLSSYYRLDQAGGVLKDKFKNLCGHPKMLFWFIFTAQQHTMVSEADLLSLWDKIEDGAVGLYRQQIESTIKAFGLSPEKLVIYSRNLCLLHTHAFINNESGYLEFDTLPSNWMPFIEAGLVRTVQNGTWKLYPPNRFLVKIFSRHVNWFNWDNIQHLVAAIKASGGYVATLNGKMFEFMFALELQLQSNSSLLWTRLTSDMDLEPRLDWNPSISIVDKVDDCVDENVVYVMKDPDYRKLKTDVVFYAQQNSIPVRVLCQLTVQKSGSTTKANEALQEMLKIPPLSGTNDCRIFLAPESSIRVTPTYKANFNDNNCYFIDRDLFATMMHLPLDLYNPSQTAESLKMLMDIAKDQDDVESAQNIGIFLSGSSLKRKRNKFGDMNEFYEALSARGKDARQIGIIRTVFEAQEIGVDELLDLTDGELKEVGVTQLGLRIAILAVLGK